MEKNGVYKVGDQVVHSSYGVGEVTGIVEKQLSGEATFYYCVSGSESTYYVPINNASTTRIRPVASGQQLAQALNTLGQSPVAMDEDYKNRRARIKEVSVSGGLQPMVELLRDLEGRRMTGKITDAEKQAFDTVEMRLAAEWAVVLEISLEEARSELLQRLKSGTHVIQAGG